MIFAVVEIGSKQKAGPEPSEATLVRAGVTEPRYSSMVLTWCAAKLTKLTPLPKPPLSVPCSETS